jgi:hypothetical protein
LQFKDLERKGNILLNKKNTTTVSTNPKIQEEKNVVSEKSLHRLIDVAKEFKVSIKDLSVFLNSKGNKVEPKPNIKISSKQYDLLRKQFVIRTNKTAINKKSKFNTVIDNFISVRKKEGKSPPKLKRKSIYLKRVRGGRPESNCRKF